MSDEIKWRYWETNDSEYGKAFIGNMKLIVQDCDGDFSRWQIKRGRKYLASGQCNGNYPYHFDRAKEKVIEVASYLNEAHELNILALNSETGTQTDNSGTENSLSAKSEEA